MSETPFTSLARTAQRSGAYASMAVAFSELMMSVIGKNPSSPSIISVLQNKKAETADILDVKESAIEIPPNGMVPSSSANDTSYNLAA